MSASKQERKRRKKKKMDRVSACLIVYLIETCAPYTLYLQVPGREISCGAVALLFPARLFPSGFRGTWTPVLAWLLEVAAVVAADPALLAPISGFDSSFELGAVADPTGGDHAQARTCELG